MLESRARARSSSVAEAMRSKIVLSLAVGNSQAQTSRTVDCSVNTVRLWKERFLGGTSRWPLRQASWTKSQQGKRATRGPECCDLRNANRLMDRRTGRLARLPPTGLLAANVQLTNSSGYANLSIKEGIESISAVRKPGHACCHSLGSRKLPTTRIGFPIRDRRTAKNSRGVERKQGAASG